ncbi:MAG TPA: hypothetical protein VHD32_05295 [Candidatus Didemnitutus sp.]|nr:hypothetical protein [Candidatus Didemnitutus sp.]
MGARIKANWWWWTAVLMTAFKLWLTRAQPIYAIGPAIHDDRLFLDLAGHILNGDWLGPYNQLTLAKGPFFSIWVAAVFLLGIPLGLAQQAAYAGACAALTRAVRPWVSSRAARFGAYVLLLWNPMTFEGHNLTRIMRQNIYTPLALLVFASLVALCARRAEVLRRQIGWAVLAGLSFGCFWLTREESVWLVPAVLILVGWYAWQFRAEIRDRWRVLVATISIGVGAAILPLLVVASLNAHYYGWFGTVEFHGRAFEDAYGALVRIKVGPELPMVPVTRQMRETAYTLSPTFAELRAQLEGPVGDKWCDKDRFPAAERQIGGGWFMWALRDAVADSGHAHSAGEAMAFYRRIADELNAACDQGRVPARPPRSGFLPPIQPGVPQQLAQAAAQFAGYFTTFSSFVADVPPSLGDNQEVRSFRDLTHDEISPGERITTPSSPAQDELKRRQIGRLETCGRLAIDVLAFLVPLAQFVGLARLIEAVARRRLSGPLVVAIASWLACAAYIAVNVIVHVTSFNNLSPAALAAAYPLEIVFVIAVAINAWSAWRGPIALANSGLRWGVSVPAAFSRFAPSIWAAGAAGLVLAGRLSEVATYGGDVPYNDQWKIEAADILAPWVHGTLGPTAFFAHHFEHIPVWTRLLAWMDAAVSGRWDPLVQMLVNNVLYAVFAFLVVRWICRSLRLLPAFAATVVVIACGALPHSWENSAWGFQSQFPLALLFLFLHARGSFENEAGTRRWWLAQVWGLAGLFTLASMWTAPLAVVAVSAWTSRTRSRWNGIPAVTAAFGLLLLGIVRVVAPTGGSFAHTSGSFLSFLHAFLDLLGWPSGWAWAPVVMNIPLTALSLRLRRCDRATSFDRIVLALGWWSVAQCLSLAFARGSDYSGFVSRYGDLLVIGVLANALAFLRLADRAEDWRPWPALTAAAWLVALAVGLTEVSFSGHAGYFHQHAQANADLRRDAVRAYLADGNRTLLEQPATRYVLYQDVDQVTRLLDDPLFRRLLPHSVVSSSPMDSVGEFARGIESHWRTVAAISLLFLAGGLVLSLRADRNEVIAPLETSAFSINRWVGLTGAIALLLMFTWPSPLTFDPIARWRQLILPPGVTQFYSFEFVGPAEFPNGRLVGAARILPEDLRNAFFGTAPAGPELTATVRSTSFPINSPWLVVPVAGFPASTGNALRLEIDPTPGGASALIAYDGGNPADIGFWPIDVRVYRGRSARVVMVDGRAADEGWLATAPPIATDDSALAARLSRRLRYDRQAGTHATLGFIALACLGWCSLVIFRFVRGND